MMTSGYTPADGDIKASIRGHCIFFDRLVELIPARFYLPVPDDKPWFQGLSKAAKASAKRQSRHNLKEARRARHDPHLPPPSTLQTLHATLQSPSPSSHAQQGSLTYEELRQRLHRRIEELRAGRNTRPESDRHLIKEESKGKRKRTADGPDEQGKQKKVNKPAVITADPAADLSFGQIKIEGEAETKGHKKHNKKPSKLQALERARKLKEAKENPEKGEAAAKRHSWQAAASRASGVKVHDDPKLLQESIKKERRRRQQHAEKWKERVQSRDKAREGKQTARAENIKERIHQKKMRRIEKREKKLMRPGFEGRKKGYVNE